MTEELTRNQMAFEIAKTLLSSSIQTIRPPWWFQLYCLVIGKACPQLYAYNSESIAKSAYEFVDFLNRASLKNTR
jgi:hypothetical protein